MAKNKNEMPDSPEPTADIEKLADEPAEVAKLQEELKIANNSITSLSKDFEAADDRAKLLAEENKKLTEEIEKLRSGPSPSAIPKGAIVIPAGDPYVAGVWRFILTRRKIPRDEWLGYESQTLVLDPADPTTVPALENYIARCGSADPARAAEIEAELKKVAKFQKRKR